MSSCKQVRSGCRARCHHAAPLGRLRTVDGMERLGGVNRMLGEAHSPMACGSERELVARSTVESEHPPSKLSDLLGTANLWWLCHGRARG